MSIFLGIDIGTSGTKTIAIDVAGNILASATAEYPLSHPKPLWSEQDPEDWWQATIQTVRQVLSTPEVSADQVQAIGLSGQMHGSVFLDVNDKVIRPALLWNDQRTAAECDEIEQRAGGREKLIEMVANPALTGFTAPKILWLRNHEPENFERLRKVLLPKDEIRRRLTGEYATEVSDASGMLLLDVKNRQWSKPLLSALELDESLFGKVYESEEVTGTLKPEVADLLGLPASCKVVGGAGDCAAGAVGNGIVETGVVCTSLGTSGVFFFHSDTPEVDPQGRLHTFCHAVHGKWHMMGVNLAAGGSLQWFRNALCAHLKEVAAQEGKDPYELMIEEAKQAPAGSDGLLFLPYLAGERTPHADPMARGAFVGLTMSHSRGALTRSIMEGVTYALRDSLTIVEELGVEVSEIRATGGGARSPFWRQMQADILGHSVVPTTSEGGGAAYGVALLAAVGAGAYQDITEACRATIKTGPACTPNSEAKAYYDRAFPIYQSLYPALKQSYQEIGGLTE
ncbi:Xylulose kinase [Planctomycetales bacterium 10988]|nr:Xylulose kinase [Planctomycetales bacterium 10988]